MIGKLNSNMLAQLHTGLFNLQKSPQPKTNLTETTAIGTQLMRSNSFSVDEASVGTEVTSSVHQLNSNLPSRDYPSQGDTKDEMGQRLVKLLRKIEK